MTDINLSTETEPMNSAHEGLFDIHPGKNCMGMVSFEYTFSHPLSESLLADMGLLSLAKFPFGKEGRIVKIDKPKTMLIEGVLRLYRLRITLRIGADIGTVRSGFEATLAKALGEIESSGSSLKR